MSILEKYLTKLPLADKKYSLSILNEDDSFVLTVSDNKYKDAVEIKENVTLSIIGSYENLETSDEESFDKKIIEVSSTNCYSAIVDYMKNCLKDLGKDYNERMFDFSEEYAYNTFCYVVSDNENLFIRAEIDGKKIY